MEKIRSLNDILSDIEVSLNRETRHNLYQVVEGYKRSVSLGTIHLPPERIQQMLGDLGVTPSGMPIDSNGWEWDFRKEYQRGNRTFVLSGSGWYGDIMFSIIKEEE